MTITIQIGNSDDKLTQQRWAQFVEDYKHAIGATCDDGDVHFFACSEGGCRWQNAAWIISINRERANTLRSWLIQIRKNYEQDSIAWTEGNTELC